MSNQQTKNYSVKIKNHDRRPMKITLTGKQIIEGKLIEAVKKSFPNFEETDKVIVAYLPYSITATEIK
jgi:hypothetical protein